VRFIDLPFVLLPLSHFLLVVMIFIIPHLV